MLAIRTRLLKGRGRVCGFTLIELLIVIAIILILIAIALPNFLEAQERARVTRAKAHLRTMETAVTQHMITYGFLYSDYNDPYSVTRKSRNKSSPHLNLPCPISGVGSMRGRGGLTFIVEQDKFYPSNIHCPLTTPNKLIDAAKTIDPWSDGTIPVGMDSRYQEPREVLDDPKWILYSAYFVSGPDKIAGDWYRLLSFNGRALPYNPTNGTVSRGDLWMVVAQDNQFAKGEYYPLKTF